MKRKVLILLLLFLLFVLITIGALNHSFDAFDDSIYQWIFSFRNDFLDSFFKIMTMCSNTLAVVGIAIILLFLLQDDDFYLLTSTLIITVLTNQLLKHIFQRMRPDHLRLIVEKGYSYPSGHAMVSFCLYGIVLYLLLTKVHNRGLKIIGTILLLSIILFVGLSRIYLGVHYPSDIIGGYLLSFLIMVIYIPVFNDYFRGQ